jgi:integrase
MEDGKQAYKSLELPAHLPQNEYDTAVSEASKWFEGISQGGRAKPGTVKEAADMYIRHLELKKGDRAAADARGRINRHILPNLAKIPLDKLRSDHIEDWHTSFVAEGSDEKVRKSKATANRNLTTLKAMLNNAYKKRMIQTRWAWTGVDKFKHTKSAREEYLDRVQIKKLLEASEGHFKTLLTAGALTGARYGELVKLKVRDLDKHRDLLNIPRGKTEPREFPLTKQTKAFFTEQAKGKLPEAYLLTKDGVKPWGPSDQTKLMRDAAVNADLPSSVVFYTLRHSFIADLINEMSVFNIAKITGTSIKMIEDHYGKLFKDRVTEVLERSSLV